MVEKGDLPADPRGLIFEAYRIAGITEPECRSIFFDWALGAEPGTDLEAGRQSLLAVYGQSHPDHPMTAVLREAMPEGAAPRRRGGRGRSRNGA